MNVGIVDRLTEILGVIIALSVASERLVEIIKNLFHWLDTPKKDKNAERWRKLILQVLAVFTGILTAWLASDYLLAGKGNTWITVIGLGLLASGGSSFWNSILTYVAKVKDIKKVEAEERLKPLRD